jgi:hypothetical protein
MRRFVTVVAVLTAALALAAPAAAYWHAGGAGSGAAPVATLLGGVQPTVSASGQTVTVQWKQTVFTGNPLGSYAGGGYTVKRYPAAGGAAVTPNASCDATVTGATVTLTCQESNTPLGSWQYTVTPVLKTWTGDESPTSSAVSVVPTLSSATAQNPASGQTTGNVQVAWSTATGATGYNVYRRTSSGSYNYAAPLNGATPVSGTSYADAGFGLTAGATYFYVVRAIQGSESPSSNELSATVISRPAAPASATGTATAGAQIAVGWPAVSGAAGYNVYRRASGGSYNYAAPLNGASPVTGTGLTDATAVDGTTYRYVVRAVTIGAGGAQVESADSPESAAVTADGTAPPAPTALTVGAGAGPLLPSATCAFSANTRFVNNAGKAAVPVTATIAAPETGETVLFSATSGGTPVTKSVAASGSTVTTTLDLSGTADGTATITARTVDIAGNQSATKAPAGPVVKDTVGQLSGLAYTDSFNNSADTLAGASECGATITATQTTGPSSGTAFNYTVTPAGGAFSGMTLDAINGNVHGQPYAYGVTAGDLAGNTSPTLTVSGTDTK